MDEESLEKSIELYKTQLHQVEGALAGVGPEGDQGDLLHLQSDLQEVIQLTEESLLSLKKSKLLNFVDELSGQASGESSTNTLNNFNAELEAFQNSLLEDVIPTIDPLEERDADEEEDDLCGTQCRLLYSQEWGASQYHNAIILRTESSYENQVKVRVLFCNPTHTSMVPCPYYLEGECKFSEIDCRYSHGYVVNVSDLEKFQEPDFSKLSEGSKCLARHSDSIWHRAMVQTIDHTEHQIQVKYDNYDDSEVLDLESILPIDEMNYSSSSESEDDAAYCPPLTAKTGEEQEMDSTAILWQPGSNSAIGEWEQFTSGIGSKLMLKMGYEYGKGLGKNGEGRIEPVEAVLVPQGKSLDHCMELKERKKLNIVDKKKKTDQKKVKHKRENVFDFINSKLKLGRKKKINEFLKKTIGPKKPLDNDDTVSQGQTGRVLNIKLVQTQEEIHKVEKHLAHKKRAIQRNSRDKTTVTHMQDSIKEMEKYLLKLRASENVLQKSQHSRNQHKKLTIF